MRRNSPKSQSHRSEIQQKVRSKQKVKPEIFVPLSKPVDMESVPIKYRALLEVCIEESEKARNSGLENPPFAITRAKVNAKIRELRRKKDKS
jgi:hypothetical protein